MCKYVCINKVYQVHPSKIYFSVEALNFGENETEVQLRIRDLKFSTEKIFAKKQKLNHRYVILISVFQL